MKTLRLSDEDYQALLRVLTDASHNAVIVHEMARQQLRAMGKGEPQGSTIAMQECERVRDLLRPIEYEEEPCKSE